MKDILVLGEGPTQELSDTTITADAKYFINFTKLGKRFVLILQYNGSNSFFFVNISKDFSFYNIKKVESKKVIKVFSVDYNAIDTSDILDIHRNLIKET